MVNRRIVIAIALLEVLILVRMVKAQSPFLNHRRTASRPPVAAGGGGSVPPEIVASQVTNTTSSSQTHVLGIDVPTGANRMLQVAVSWGTTTPQPCDITIHNSGVQTATYFGSQRLITYAVTNAIFYLKNPNTGVNVVSNRFGNDTAELSFIITLWTNVNQTTPMDSFASSTGNTSSQQNTISAADTDIGVDVWNYYTPGLTHTPGSGQTMRADAPAAADTLALKLSTRPLGNSTTTNMSWSINSTVDNAHLAFRIKGP